MIKEKSDRFKTTEIITRICDCCRKEEKRTYGQLKYSKIRKKLGKDYCKKCAYQYRIIHQSTGADSPFWRGGMHLSTCGYWRYTTGEHQGEYVHKVKYGKHIGRKLTKEEQVHHIDMNKLNNDIDNMFLCKNKKHHHKIHSQMEALGFQLFFQHIWYNFDNNEYDTRDTGTVHPFRLHFTLDLSHEYNLSFSVSRSGKRYVNAYVGHRKHVPYHRVLVQNIVKRKMKRHEHVHHIDGNVENNRIENLVLLTRGDHKNTHNSLHRCVAKLYKNDVVRFEDGFYHAN